MKALIYTPVLGVVCMLAEMLNLRKGIVPLAVIGLLAIFGLNLTDWNVNRLLYHNMVDVSKYGVAFSGLLILLTAFIVTLSHHFYKNEETKISDYVSIIIFALSGAIAMVSFGNLAMFFVGLEVLSISLYILAGSKKKDLRSNEAGMKYFLMGSFASGILLFGIALVYGDTSSFDLAAIANTPVHSVLFYVGAGLILMAMFFKVSAVPFHFWAPDVYDGSPTLITTFMATVAKIAAFAAFYHLFSAGFKESIHTYAWIISGITALTIIVGNITALTQDSFKRMLAFSGVSHAGYLMLGIVSCYQKSDNAIFFYSLAYGLSSVAAFAIAIAVAENTGSDKFESFNGLGKRKPFLALALTIAMLSLAGIPPFAGFFGKYYIFSEAVKTGHIFITIIAIVNSIISVYYYFKVILAMYTKDSTEVVFKIKLTYSIVIIICILLTIALGVMPSALANLF